MIQPVTRDRNNEGEVIMMDMKDVFFIEIEHGSVVFTAASGKYYPLVPSLSMYANYVQRIGFERLDRTNLVNMARVMGLDEKRGIVFFNPEYDQPHTTVSFKNLRKIKDAIPKPHGHNLSPD